MKSGAGKRGKCECTYVFGNLAELNMRSGQGLLRDFLFCLGTALTRNIKIYGP